MTVRSLGYLGISVSDIAAWRSFAADVLGMQVDGTADGGLRLRLDSRDWRIQLFPSGEDDIMFAGWEVGGPDELALLIDRLESEGVAVERDDGTLARARGVFDVARFTDPCGMTCELFWGATERLERPFASPAGTSGFVIGDQGLGHIVIATPDAPATLAFYKNILGFGFSDHIDMPMGPHIVPVTFMHCNSRHHSFAFAPVPSPKKLIHFMLQAANLDDVGFALDRVKQHGIELSLTLGKHVNDHMLSFYAYTPSGFEVEYGWGARTIDPAKWLPVRHDRISMWGHHFVGRPGTVQA